MRIIGNWGSARVLLGAVALSVMTSLVAVGCGGADSSGKATGGAGGSTIDMGGTSSGGSSVGGADHPHAGSPSTGGSGPGTEGGDGAMAGAGGEAGEGTLPPSKEHSAVTFVAGGAISKSKNFTLIGNIGEGLGSTGKQSRSLLHTFIPGVIAAASP